MNQIDELTNQYMDQYFKMKEQFHRLNEPNKMLIGQIEEAMANMPENSQMKNLVNMRLEEYDRKNYTGINNTQELPMVRKRQLPAVIKEKKAIDRAGFINMTILIYGIINIGIILAIAFMK